MITNTGSIANLLVEYRGRRKPKHRFVWGVLAGDGGGRRGMRPWSSEVIVTVLDIMPNARRRRLRVEDRLMLLLLMSRKSVVALLIELRFQSSRNQNPRQPLVIQIDQDTGESTLSCRPDSLEGPGWEPEDIDVHNDISATDDIVPAEDRSCNCDFAQSSRWVKIDPEDEREEGVVEEKARREAEWSESLVVGDEAAPAVASGKRFPVDSVGTGRTCILGFDFELEVPYGLGLVGIAVQMTSQPSPVAGKIGTGSSDFAFDDVGIESVGPDREAAESLIGLCGVSQRSGAQADHRADERDRLSSLYFECRMN